MLFTHSENAFLRQSLANVADLDAFGQQGFQLPTDLMPRMGVGPGITSPPPLFLDHAHPTDFTHPPRLPSISDLDALEHNLLNDSHHLALDPSSRLLGRLSQFNDEWGRQHHTEPFFPPVNQNHPPNSTPDQ